jgi:hypothetical protein
MALEAHGCRGKKSLCVGSSGVTLAVMRLLVEVVEVCWN